MEREELLQLYKKEKDPNVKDRLMLNIRIRFEDHSITAVIQMCQIWHLMQTDQWVCAQTILCTTKKIA